MALVVEDGTGKPDAEAFISYANAVTFLQSRGDTVFAGLTAAVGEPLLRLGTDFLTQMYRGSWRGSRVFDTQALDWPRNGVVLDNGNATSLYGYGITNGIAILNNVVPTEVQRANAMLALIANSGPLAPDISRAVLSRKVDVIETHYDPRAPVWKVYRAVAMTLGPYLNPLNSGVCVPLGRT